VRGLLTDGQRKSMVPIAARLGTDHQRLQQFITSGLATGRPIYTSSIVQSGGAAGRVL